MSGKSAASGRTPWHLYAVGVLGVVWNAYGCYDYVMSKTGGEAYLRSVGMNDAMIAHFNAMPPWMTAVWAVGVWGALAGSLLLLLRSRLAVATFLASLIAYVFSLIYSYVISPAPGGGPSMMAVQGVILIGCLFFAWYALTMRRAGVLR